MDKLPDSILKTTRTPGHVCRLAYSADEHGWSAGAFHAQVDTFGAALVLGTTAGGAVFGGYNPRGWIGKQNHDLHMMTHTLTLPTPSAYITTYCYRVPDVSGVLEKCTEVSIKTVGA